MTKLCQPKESPRVELQDESCREPGSFNIFSCGHKLGLPEESMSSALLLCSVIHYKLPHEKDNLDLNADLEFQKELTVVSFFLKEELSHALYLPLPGSYPELIFW